MVVFVYGYEGSGPQHWQRWLHGELEECGLSAVFPELSNPLEPQKSQWVDELAVLVEASSSPVHFVAHSLGCWAVDHYLHEHGAGKVESAFLVAPPSPQLIFEAVETFLPPPLVRMDWQPIASRSLIVSSDDDDFAEPGEIAAIAASLGVAHTSIANGGHLNAASGYGPWPFALDWLKRRLGEPAG